MEWNERKVHTGELVNYVYLLPFSYFYHTRLRHGKLAFHVFFEWLAAVVVACAVGADAVPLALYKCGLSYIAFISLYEIGYLANDLYSSHREEDGRMRGPQQAARSWIAAWVLSRILAFVWITVALHYLFSAEWWLFYLSLIIIFTVHNVLTNKQYRAGTFLWLAWFRFMAPVIFVVQASQRMGVAFAAAMAYSAFRLVGYLDSKGLLQMPDRQQSRFRIFFFFLPMAGVLALFPYQEAMGFAVLVTYFALAASLEALGLF